MQGASDRGGVRAVLGVEVCGMAEAPDAHPTRSLSADRSAKPTDAACGDSGGFGGGGGGVGGGGGFGGARGGVGGGGGCGDGGGKYGAMANALTCAVKKDGRRERQGCWSVTAMAWSVRDASRHGRRHSSRTPVTAVNAVHACAEEPIHTARG